MVTHHWWEDFASLSLPKAKNSLCITAPDYPHKTGGDINMPNSYFYAWTRFWRKDSICDLEINFDRSFIKQSISHTFSKLCWKLFLIFPPKTTSNYLSPKSNLESVVQTVKKWVVRGKKSFNKQSIFSVTSMNTCNTSNHCYGQTNWPRPLKFWCKKRQTIC